MIKEDSSKIQDNNNTLLNSNINNENMSYVNRDVEELIDVISMLEFQDMENTTLRELHIAVTNATKEHMKCLPNNDSRLKTLKGNKARKHLMNQFAITLTHR